MLKPVLVVVDPDAVRRNAVVQLMYSNARHVEPYESSNELSRFWPAADIVLVHDESDALERVLAVMAQRGAWFPTVAYAAEPKPARIVDAIHTGAVDYLGWPFSALDLSTRLEIVLDRRDSVLEVQRLAIRARQLIDRLSPREREVLSSLAKGASNKIIARNLQISPRTIEVHRANMMGKLGVKHVGEAVSIAHRAGLPQDEEV